MADVAVRACGLGKQYRLGAFAGEGGGVFRYKSLREAIAAAVRAPFRWRGGSRGGARGELFWALTDLSFEIVRGEVVGIIGRNGAGKSTLLKILSRITDPTAGYVDLDGRVGSLLEVGTGFHPELTGRENIYLNGSILGMKKAEIAARFNEIVAFSEIGRFLDTPVKHYSSGMYTRLAFAVAAHLEPEILVVDEVLAVGDAQFQRKCLGKMGEVARQGRTVLFVSHNMQAVRSLCTRGLYLEAGRLVLDGTPGEVVARYLADSRSEGPDSLQRTWSDTALAPGNEKIRLESVRIRPLAPDGEAVIGLDTPLDIEFTFWNQLPDARITLCMVVSTIDGVVAFETLSDREPNWRDRSLPRGRFLSVCRIPANLLNAGFFKIRILFTDTDGRRLLNLDDAISFTVHDLGHQDIAFFGKWTGIFRPRLDWRMELLSA